MNMKSLITTIFTLLCMAFLPAVQAAESGVSYTRIVSGPDGESWFEEGEFAYNILELGEIEAGLSSLELEGRGNFMMFPSGVFEDFHPTPNSQILVVIQGDVEVGTSDGDKRQFGPGDVVLMQDNSGKGHTTRTFGDVNHIALMIPYDNR